MTTKIKYEAYSRILLLMMGIVSGIVIGEVLLRTFLPSGLLETSRELKQFRMNDQDLTRIFTLDPEFGFRPILGNSEYNKYGTKVNHYNLEKKPGIARLLFIGDSVTSRGMILDELRKIYGEDKFEYWNAGVESFNTVQEVNFYTKYNRYIKPDKVILFFHNNDFETTPVAFLNKENKLVVYSADRPLSFPNRWLFKNSYLYRLFYRRSLAQETMVDMWAIAQETKRSLKDLKDVLGKEGIQLSIVVLPIIDVYERWNDREKESRRRIISILKELNIEYIDLFEVIDSFQEAIIEDSIHDPWHPNKEVASYFARYLYEHNVF